jgi:uncharacterized protein
MQIQQEFVLLFTRYPEPGSTKTRLIPLLGAQGAANLQKKMSERIVAETILLAESRPISLEIHYDGGNLTQMRAWLGDSCTFIRQTDDNLGARMANAIITHLHKEKSIVLAGSDCPGISSRILAEALDALATHHLVIGPAFDGGYYLIGAAGTVREDMIRSLFTGICWSTQTVFTETMARVNHLQLTCHILPELHDIDTPEDLGYLNYYPDAE